MSAPHVLKWMLASGSCQHPGRGAIGRRRRSGFLDPETQNSRPGEPGRLFWCLGCGSRI